MKTLTEKLELLEIDFDEIINRLHEFEAKYENEIALVNQNYKKSP